MMRKLIYLIIHLLQLGLVYGIYVVNDLYANHLGFMRNTSFFSEEFAQSWLGRYLVVLPIVMLLLSIFLVWRERTKERYLLLIIAAIWLSWLYSASLQLVPIYYLVVAIIFVILLLQLLLIGLVGRKNRG
ncbi:hypothetical protein [Agrilactobacillus composti]|uniref:hypothetical protein n=1 Tax=Agrilactobacillus composti TaxID=398555 RepID=UPI0009DF046B|nr:hypothetical protein [Agrilactobacillus composti]